MRIFAQSRQRWTGLRRRATLAAPRTTRLHAEPLEPRLLMSADDALSASLTGFASDEAVTTPASPIFGPQMLSGLPPQFDSEAAFRDWLVDLADQQYGHLFGTETTNYGGAELPVFRHGGIVLDATLSANGIASDAMAFDATNVQVEGVDEADLVEADGERLVFLRDNRLYLFRADGQSDLELAATVELDQPASQMFLHGDRLAIVSETGGNPSTWTASPLLRRNVAFLGMPTYQWGTDSVPPKTQVTVLDLSDLEQPTLVQQTELDGSVVDLRSVDGTLRVVTTESLTLPKPKFIPDEPADDSTADSKSDATDDAMFTLYQPVSGRYETREAYLARLQDEVIADLLPQFRSYGADGTLQQEGPLAEFHQLFRPVESIHQNAFQFHAVTTIDMHRDEPGPIDSEVILTAPGAHVYATASDVYLFSTTQLPIDGADSSGILPSWQTTKQGTNIWKFAVDDESGDVELDAKGQVEGRLLNQFAADEYEGTLRLVMTGVGSNWQGSQGVYTLQQQEHRLEVVGQIDDIAPNENLHSVTFAGEVAHFVTYRKVDPLFAVDLSDPTAPVVTGELKIPGYSEHLVRMDGDHLLGIGRDAVGNLFDEMQLSIFDVSDPTAPERIHVHSIGGGRSTIAEATGNRWVNGDGDHHALAYYADQQLLALPLQTAEFFTDTETLFEPGEGGLHLYRVDAAQGIELAAQIEHDAPVRRTVRVGDRLYVLSDAAVTSHDLSDPGATIDHVPLDEATDASHPTSPQLAEARLLHALPAYSGRDFQPTGPVSLAPTFATAQREAVDAALAMPRADAPRQDRPLDLLRASPVAESPSPAAHDQALANDDEQPLGGNATPRLGTTMQLADPLGPWELL